MNDYPLLKDGDKPVYPVGGKCTSCGSGFTKGLAYISAGALLMDESGENSIPTERLLAFFQIGWHADSEERSVHVDIVADLARGQFDIQFCSRQCLGRWFGDVLARLPDIDES